MRLQFKKTKNMDFFLREEQCIFQEIIRRDTQGYVMGEGTAEIPRQIIAKQIFS